MGVYPVCGNVVDTGGRYHRLLWGGSQPGRRMRFVPVVLLVVLMVLGLAGQRHLTRQIDLEGPHTLAAAPDGGFYMATSTRLYRLDSREQVVAQYEAATLGVGRFDDLLVGSEGRLWVYDSEARRVLACDLPAPCQPFDAGQTAFSANAILAERPAGQGLLLSDNRHHRLWALDAQGRVQSHPLDAGWRFPNQIRVWPGGWLMADTERRQLVKVVADAQGLPVRRELFLQAEGRPYRFVVRPDGIWTVEAGLSLNDGGLFRYREGRRERVRTGAGDVGALIAVGDKLVLSSRQDWRVRVSDDGGARWRDLADGALSQAHAAQRDRNATLTSWSRGLPVGMGVVALALLGWAWHRERRAGRVALAAPAPWSVGTAALPITEGARLQPRPQARRALRGAMVVYGLLPLPILAWMAWQLWPYGVDPQGQRLLYLVGAFALLWPVAIYLAWRWGLGRRWASLAIVQDERLLLLTWWDGQTRAAPYEQVWLGRSTLWVDGVRVSLSLWPGVPMWERDGLAEALQRHGHAHHVFDSEGTLWRALWQARHAPALRWLAGRALACVCLVVALCWRFGAG